MCATERGTYHVAMGKWEEVPEGHVECPECAGWGTRNVNLPCGCCWETEPCGECEGKGYVPAGEERA